MLHFSLRRDAITLRKNAISRNNEGCEILTLVSASSTVIWLFVLLLALEDLARLLFEIGLTINMNDADINNAIRSLGEKVPNKKIATVLGRVISFLEMDHWLKMDVRVLGSQGAQKGKLFSKAVMSLAWEISGGTSKGMVVVIVGLATTASERGVTGSKTIAMLVCSYLLI